VRGVADVGDDFGVAVDHGVDCFGNVQAKTALACGRLL